MASSRWWTTDSLAVVTGGNKGIGFEIAKQLSAKGISVVLTARDQKKGLAALSKLRTEHGSSLSNVIFHALDVCSSESVSEFSSWINQKHRGLDILVNNAGVLDYVPSCENAKLVLNTNYYGLKQVTEALLPCMRTSPMGSRIVNVSSTLGQLKVVSPLLRQEVENPETLTEEKLDIFVNRFLQDLCRGNASSLGWPSGLHAAYCVSKLAVNAYTRILARTLEENQPSNHKIYVNSMHPGYVKTDMTKNQGILSPVEAADTAVWLALHPLPVPSGEFFYERKPCSF